MTHHLVPLVLALQLDKTLYPWGSPTTLALFGGAGVALALFVARSLRSENPILDLSLFSNRVFSAANLALFFLGGAFLSILIFLPLFMVNVLGVSATRAGVSLIPLSLGLVFGSVVAGQLVSRVGHYRLFMLGGGLILLAGTLLLSSMSAEVSYLRVTLYMVVCGLGLGPSFPLYTLAIQNAVDERKIGQATSASQFFRQIGGTVGAALMGTVLAAGLATGFAGAFGPTPAVQESTGVPAGNFSSAEGLTQGGPQEVASSVREAFDARYALIERVVREGDGGALETLLADPQLPEAFRARLQNAEALSGAGEALQNQVLGTIRTQLDAQAEEVVAQVTRAVRITFAGAITDIYRYAAIFVVLSWIATLFVPELKLRSSNAPAPAIAD